MKWSPAPVVLVPSAVVTVTSTVPDPAGDVAVIVVLLLTVKAEAADPPNWIAVTPVKFVPVIVTEVPPEAGPLVGDTPLTVGGEPPPPTPSTITVTLITRDVVLVSMVNVSVPEKVVVGGL